MQELLPIKQDSQASRNLTQMPKPSLMKKSGKVLTSQEILVKKTRSDLDFLFSIKLSIYKADDPFIVQCFIMCMVESYSDSKYI